MNYNLIVYEFDRPSVEHGDLSHFLALYGPDSLPKGAPLREMMNSFAFSIKGWADDPREIHLILQPFASNRTDFYSNRLHPDAIAYRILRLWQRI